MRRILQISVALALGAALLGACASNETARSTETAAPETSPPQTSPAQTSPAQTSPAQTGSAETAADGAGAAESVDGAAGTAGTASSVAAKSDCAAITPALQSVILFSALAPQFTEVTLAKIEGQWKILQLERVPTSISALRGLSTASDRALDLLTQAYDIVAGVKNNGDDPVAGAAKLRELTGGADQAQVGSWLVTTGAINEAAAKSGCPVS